MLHIHGSVPDSVQWSCCIHKSTQQRYYVLQEDANIETPHGTMAGRVGDVLLEGADGSFYVIRHDAFVRVYDINIDG